jgi:hypothetical protein
MSDWEMLVHIFKLLCFLSFDERNIDIIVREGGIQIVCKAIAKHARREDLIVRAIKTIDFVAMADQKCVFFLFSFFFSSFSIFFSSAIRVVIQTKRLPSLRRWRLMAQHAAHAAHAWGPVHA